MLQFKYLGKARELSRSRAFLYPQEVINIPTRKIFDFVVVMWIGLEMAWGLPKLWAHRKSTDTDAGPISKTVAGAIEAVH